MILVCTGCSIVTAAEVVLPFVCYRIFLFLGSSDPVNSIVIVIPLILLIVVVILVLVIVYCAKRYAVLSNSYTMVWPPLLHNPRAYLLYTAKSYRRFYGKITGNQLPVHFPFLRAPVNIFGNQAQYGSERHVLLLDIIALKP